MPGYICWLEPGHSDNTGQVIRVQIKGFNKLPHSSGSAMVWIESGHEYVWRKIQYGFDPVHHGQNDSLQHAAYSKRGATHGYQGEAQP